MAASGKVSIRQRLFLLKKLGQPLHSSIDVRRYEARDKQYPDNCHNSVYASRDTVTDQGGFSFLAVVRTAAVRASGCTFRKLLAALAANDECHFCILSFAQDGSVFSPCPQLCEGSVWELCFSRS